jgi:hypothetical protein
VIGDVSSSWITRLSTFHAAWVNHAESRCCYEDSLRSSRGAALVNIELLPYVRTVSMRSAGEESDEQTHAYRKKGVR